MSNFMIAAKRKSDGLVYPVSCIDDYFGHRQFGYIVHPKKGVPTEVMTEEEFRNLYEEPDMEPVGDEEYD